MILKTITKKPKIKLQDIYKTQDLISTYLDPYQAHLYAQSATMHKRNTSVLTVRITSLKLNLKMSLENMDKQKTINQTQSCKWAYSWMAMASL